MRHHHLLIPCSWVSRENYASTYIHRALWPFLLKAVRQTLSIDGIPTVELLLGQFCAVLWLWMNLRGALSRSKIILNPWATTIAINKLMLSLRLQSALYLELVILNHVSLRVNLFPLIASLPFYLLILLKQLLIELLFLLPQRVFPWLWVWEIVPVALLLWLFCQWVSLSPVRLRIVLTHSV